MDGMQNEKQSFPLWAWRLAGGGLLLAFSGFFCWSYCTGGIAATVLSTTLPSAKKVEAIQELFAAWGNLAPLAYLLLVIAEVVIAPIPGTLLYLPGGMLFGGFWGGTITLIGNTIGAGVACAIMRSLLGPEAREKIGRSPFFIRQRQRIERHGIGIILLLAHQSAHLFRPRFVCGRPDPNSVNTRHARNLHGHGTLVLFASLYVDDTLRFLSVAPLAADRYRNNLSRNPLLVAVESRKKRESPLIIVSLGR